MEARQAARDGLEQDTNSANVPKQMSKGGQRLWNKTRDALRQSEYDRIVGNGMHISPSGLRL